MSTLADESDSNMVGSYIAIIAGVAFCVSPWRSPGVALAIGIVCALIGLVHAARVKWIKPASRILLQAAVVLLGFKMDLRELAHAGSQGLLFAMGTIVLVFVCAKVFSIWLGTTRNVTMLVASGTAICGGSAIAAIGPVIEATAAEMSVAIGTVFMLNAAGLYVLPALGHWLDLSQAQFGTWAAVSIHDVSSVTGAAAKYGSEALSIATAVKLARAIWIAPIAAIAGWWTRNQTHHSTYTFRMPIPPFILLFIAASTVRSFWPQIAGTIGAEPDGRIVFERFVQQPALAMMSASLLLIGMSLNRATIASVGWRAFVLGVLLWVVISVVSLMVIMRTIA
jgi:uncharacterized integral membrane protein (TIGR00698 family)